MAALRLGRLGMHDCLDPRNGVSLHRGLRLPGLLQRIDRGFPRLVHCVGPGLLHLNLLGPLGPVGNADCLGLLTLSSGEITPSAAVVRLARRCHGRSATPAAKSAVVGRARRGLLGLTAQAAILEGWPHEAKAVAAALLVAPRGRRGADVLLALGFVLPRCLVLALGLAVLALGLLVLALGLLVLALGLAVVVLSLGLAGAAFNLASTALSLGLISVLVLGLAVLALGLAVLALGLVVLALGLVPATIAMPFPTVDALLLLFCARGPGRPTENHKI